MDLVIYEEKSKIVVMISKIENDECIKDIVLKNGLSFAIVPVALIKHQNGKVYFINNHRPEVVH